MVILVYEQKNPIFLHCNFVFGGCSKDDCTKVVMTPDYSVGGNYYPSQKLEIPCDDPGPIGRSKEEEDVVWLKNSKLLTVLKPQD